MSRQAVGLVYTCLEGCMQGSGVLAMQQEVRTNCALHSSLLLRPPRTNHCPALAFTSSTSTTTTHTTTTLQPPPPYHRHPRPLHPVQVLRQCVERYFPGAAGPLERASVCMFTNTPDEHFLLDRHPRHPQVRAVGAEPLLQLT